MPTKITDLTVHDIRFPTSRALDGSDAMNPAPDYSATYVVLKTNSPQGLAGHGLTFTIGRGNEICVTAVKSLAALVVGATLEEIFADLAVRNCRRQPVTLDRPRKRGHSSCHRRDRKWRVGSVGKVPG
jgi:L-alanine-DL-glutamate epimerase-like enolase superfamily enzyme